MGWRCTLVVMAFLSRAFDFDYDQPIEDRRIRRQVAPNIWSGAATSDPGEGRTTTYREFLGRDYFDALNSLGASGGDRIVFWFDN
jgi:hypothetical protein